MAETSKIKHWAAAAHTVDQTGRTLIEVGGIEIGLFKVADRYYAWRNMCPHAAAPVCAGTVCGTKLPSAVYEYVYGRDQEILRCPWHGWEFDLVTGKHLADDSVKLRGYTLEVEDGQIYLLL
ncbi:Rieske (2Fe-2S) protein [Paenibacillus koleovorans]|uniref:Rieske (2Fe-2S) protein n=1 Tax=Paenibacillus koleovorans TaxID=121608 RepID=UPI000FD93684|nr:Rieske 2Fe-2S domain-containing protein [Paenibacillus koleovorans]